METSTLQVIIEILAFVVIPLGILGALANTLGVDARDDQQTTSKPTSPKW